MKFVQLINTTSLIIISTLSTTALADHSWSTYHWAKTTTMVNLPVIDSVTIDWQGSFDNSIEAWEKYGPISHTVESEDDRSRIRKRCSAKTGKMKVCNAGYGYNGWAGLASINIDSNGHIVKGVAKMNDSYMEGDTDDYRNHVMCQEMGHIYGLGHTSEDGSSQKTCMDYSDDLASQWPNDHDYELLTAIYNHIDDYDSTIASSDDNGDAQPCRGGPKKCGSNSNASLGIKVFQRGRAQIWVSHGENGSTWIHHITLAKGYDDIVHDDSH